MNYLINASNLKQGGGIQVAQSICSQLKYFHSHRFIVVLSSYIDGSFIDFGRNVKVLRYNIKNSLPTLLLGKDGYLDALVQNEKVDAVLTVFGPSRWKPAVPHLCGFARAQLVLKNSPCYQRKTIRDRLNYYLWTWAFKKSSNTFYTENKYISDLLPDLLGNINVYTVSNYYNQIFDQPEKWGHTNQLKPFDGITTLSVSSHYPHKNFEILIIAARHLQRLYPDFKFRFVLTFDAKEMPVPDDVREHFIFLGKVEVNECPNLYEQADIMFMPTLMECFTATYPEAMRMGVPIITTDLDFARGLCGEAACYYDAVSPLAAAEAIYKVAKDKEYATNLVKNGKEQLKKFDNYEQRAEKIIKILEEIA